MNKSKLCLLMMSMLAITSLASCNNNDRRSESSSEPQISENSSDNPSSDIGGDAELVSISLNKTQANIMVGSTETLTVTFNPADAKDKELVWASDNTAVATVENGVVTAVKAGSANITATSKNKASISATCAVTVTDNVVVSGVDAKAEFVSFNSHKSKDSSADDGFYDHEQSYKVGDDNNFNVKPVLNVLDAKTYLPVSASKWPYDFRISATLNDQPAGSEYFSVVDARECDVKFTSEAVGKTFTISVAPGGVAESRIASLTRTITVEVVDGYNVYDAKEIGYFDTREQNSTIDSPTMENDQPWQCKWAEFKSANGMDPAKHPAALIFQKDIKVTTADLPSNFFYSAEQVASFAESDEKAIGSFVDFTYLYEHTTEDGITVDGNYFQLDFSEIPLVVRDRCKKTEVGQVVSHSAAFKAIAGTDIVFKNINMSGNARNATSAEDAKLSGGFIFAKGAGSQSFNAYNIIATKFYITFMGEKPYITGNPITQFDLNKVKCFNNFNSFLYNWGTTIQAKDSLFRSCGGPIVIQDHTSTDEYENKDGEGHNIGTEVYGFAPTTRFVDCSLNNYVAGTEAWFSQFGVTSLVNDIKRMSDLLAATQLPKSFVVNSAREGKTYLELSAQSLPAFFNFIVVSKSGSSEGITATPNCGTVEITNSNKELVYNYRQPAYDSLYQAFAAYQMAAATGASAEEQAALYNKVGEIAIVKGVISGPTDPDAATKIQAYLETICTVHSVFRYINNTMGAPVFDLGPAYDLLMYDNNNQFLQSMMAVYGGSGGMYAATNEQKAATPDAVALYYQGMMLVFGLTPYVA